MEGLVINNTGSRYEVITPEGTRYQCRVKGALRLQDIPSTNPVAIGDHVFFDTSVDGTAFIHRIGQRKNYIIRKASNLSKQCHIMAANIDLCVLMVTVSYPHTTTVFIDRFLASARAYRIPVALLFNKTDLYSPVEERSMRELINIYSAISYPCYPVSAIKGQGLESVVALLDNKITLFAGHSGVGKSTLINAILPNERLRTGEISAYHHKGTHTTTFYKMYPLENGTGYIIDSPGIKGFGLYDMKREEIGHYFPEIFKHSAMCRYGNCVHLQEPGCAVRQAVQRGEINPSRYASYLSMLDDVNQDKYRQAF